MFYLCTVQANDLTSIFGRFSPEEVIPAKYPNLNTIMIGQKPDYTGYLLFSDQVIEEFTQQSSIPQGYDFIFRQEWGLIINEEILHRVIATLRAEAYPPMADYLDAKVKGDVAQESEYITKCQAVKIKYPKFTW